MLDQLSEGSLVRVQSEERKRKEGAEIIGTLRLIFDSGSGRLLAGETRGKNRNGTRDDVDDNFTAWLAAGYVHSFHARP